MITQILACLMLVAFSGARMIPLGYNPHSGDMTNPDQLPAANRQFGQHLPQHGFDFGQTFGSPSILCQSSNRQQGGSAWPPPNNWGASQQNPTNMCP